MIDLFSGVRSLEVSMDYHLNRQVMLNSNISNINTPGYRPVDLGLLPPDVPGRPPDGFADTSSTAEGAAGLVLVRTMPGHMDPAVRPAMLVPFEDPSATAGNDLNFVDMDRELAKVAANTLRYETAAELMARRLGNLRYAASDGTSA